VGNVKDRADTICAVHDLDQGAHMSSALATTADIALKRCFAKA